MNNESSDGKIWNLQWWHKMASETHWYFFQNFLIVFFKDIKLLQKCNCMQKPQKYGSRAPLQICNSMRFSAESGSQIHCENATACSSRHNPAFDYRIVKTQLCAMHCKQRCVGLLDQFLLNSPLEEYILWSYDTLYIITNPVFGHPVPYSLMLYFVSSSKYLNTKQT